MSPAGSIAEHGNPRDWPIIPFRAVLSQSKVDNCTDLPLLGVNLHQGVTRRSVDDGRPAASEDLSAYKVVQPGNVVMNRLGKPHGSVGVSPWAGITSPAYWVMPVNPSLGEPRFFHHLLRSRHLIAEYERLGKNQPPNQFDISWDSFRAIELPLPPLEEQRRIADFLDAETARIDKMRTTVRRLKVVLHERSDAQRSLILRGAKKPGPRTLHPMLGDLPVSWRVVPLKHLVPRIGVGVVVDPSSYFTEEGVPFLRGSNITETGIDLTGVRFMSEADSRTLWRSRLNSGDVVVIRAGYPGRAAVVPDSLDGANCASLLVIKKGKNLLPKYLEAYFNSPLGAAYVNSVRYGAAQEQINVSHVVDFIVPVPALHEQEVIVRGLELSENPIQALKEKLSRQEVLLEERRQALITAAVTGQFDVSTASGRNVTEGVSA
ncbi:MULTISPECIES: restriction endonuclease subunit S [unclassified Streptomyces]|uniref:restriction endonuclease subunit S n=1 Tax=Streptomyces TaxID=1883 RepID=UPI000D1BB37D|nr:MULTISPECIES: restriction endonuclease subunit S [unclassified Streptomyces]MCI4145845.1 restriction endonuclease subunit S [Streptomyces sp. MMS20-AI2-20]